MNALTSSLSLFLFRPGERIVNEGDPGDLFYTIKEGRVTVRVEGKIVREMKKGDHFGEQALLHKGIRTATITAINNVTCLAIGRTRLATLLQNKLEDVLYKNSEIMAMENSLYLNKLNSFQLDEITKMVKITKFRTG